MGKKNEKIKVEEIRVEFAKKYNEQLRALQRENAELREQNTELLNKYNDAQAKLSEYEDWIERMQEFCNMSEDDRKAYLNAQQVQGEMAGLLSVTARLLKGFV